ncbi:MAG: chloride channel protein [Lachnospiraceae bacterium]|nr:chloride channel protein [Lachnospiraceae bacterium]
MKVYFLVFLKWLFFAGITGTICGLVGTAFYYCVVTANQLRGAHPYLLYFLPVAGLVIIIFYHLLHMDKDRGTNLVISSIRSKEKVPLRMMVLIFFSTTLTHLFGGSAGREGAALQIGGSIGSYVGERFKLDEKDMHMITMCGMSAVFAALFGTPLTAAIFSIEVISVGIMYYSALFPCLTASLVAFGIAQAFKVKAEHYTILAAPNLHAGSALQVAVLGVVCALVSMLFCICMHKASHLFQEKLKNPYIRVLVGAGMIILLTLLVGNQDYNGAGSAVIERAMEGEVLPWAFLLKIAFTAITLSVGFKGGEIVPTFFVGATLGCVIAPMLGLPASFGAALGLVGLFCGVVNCPITSMILSVELFGSEHLLLFAIICTVSYMLSGTYSLYSSQKIVYSKIKAKYINADAR